MVRPIESRNFLRTFEDQSGSHGSVLSAHLAAVPAPPQWDFFGRAGALSLYERGSRRGIWVGAYGKAARDASKEARAGARA